jgi:uncharacterized Zn finger protein/ERCC4-related helicase
MARIEYGHTWWGKRWLQSLTNLDYENRIPRGKRYARNGSVRTIKVADQQVSASVQGTRSTPYRVHVFVQQLSEQQKQLIIDRVKSSPYYLAQLETGMLPPELEQDCLDEGIKLFPASWKDLGMQCSCPDWAVPCKHLAAVIYTIANEIDKDPFLVFRLHGLDLIDGVYGENLPQQELIPTLKSFTEADIDSDNQDTDNPIDLSLIPDTLPAVERLLTDAPLFCPTSDFKQDLLGCMRRISKMTKTYVKQLDISEDPPDLLYDSCRIIFQKDTFSGSLSLGSERLEFNSEDMDGCIEYLKGFPAASVDVYPPVLALLILAHSFSLRLLEQSCAVPDLFLVEKKSYNIRWIPALFNPEVRSITESLTKRLPFDIVFIGKKAAGRQQQILMLVSMFIKSYLKYFIDDITIPETAEHDLFFRDALYTPQTFSQRGNPSTINLWLGRLFLKRSNWQPVICLYERPEETFLCDIQTSTDQKTPIALKDFLLLEQPGKLSLLRDLSLLGTYFDTVREALKQGGSVTVSGDDFLQQWFSALPVLKTLGIHTIVPKSLKKALLPQASVRMSLSGNDRNVSFLSLKNMLNIEWNITVGETTISLEELKTLQQESRSYVRFRDQYIKLDEKHMERIFRKLQKPARISPLDMLKTGLTGIYEGQPVVMDDEAKSLFGHLLKVVPSPVPKTLQAKLRPYQLRGYQWLCHNYTIGLGSVLADDMGLGKTIQVIALMLKLKDDRVISPKRPALIVVPASLVTNWLHELNHFAPSFTAEVYHGINREISGNAEIIITTYATVRRDSEKLNGIRFAIGVIDEAQNIKNPQTSQSKAVHQLKTDYTIALTGTPVENRMLDYWSIINAVMTGYLGNRSSFKQAYALPIERYRDQHALDTFKRITAPLVLRRLKSDRSIINDLPEKLVSNRFTDLTAQQKVLYREIVDRTEEVLQDSEGIAKAGAVFKLMTALKQVCCHPALYAQTSDREASLSGKAEMLLDLLDTIRQREEKVLIFTQYAQMGFLLQEIIEKRFGSPGLFLHGGSTRAQRDAMIDAFQKQIEQWVMILSIRAGGTGLNLTAANHVIHYDLWWNPAVENQATDRAFRIGQEKQVTVYRLITEGTFEEQINQMIESKQDLADMTVVKGEQWITELPPSELKELIRLREETSDTDR